MFQNLLLVDFIIIFEAHIVDLSFYILRRKGNCCIILCVPHHVMNIIFGNNVLHRLLQFMQKRRSSVRYGNGRDTLEKYYYLQQYLFDRRAQIWRDQIAYMNSSDNRIVYSSNPVVPQVSWLLCWRKYWPNNKF